MTSFDADLNLINNGLPESHEPFAAILSCADARLSPEIVFDQIMGDLFVLRVAGNMATPEMIASLEYAVAVLGVRLIMVLGHASCGAVDATIKVVKEGTELPGHLPSLVDAIKPAVEKAMTAKPNDLLAAATAENVRINVAYLASVDPIIAEAVKSGKVKVVGAVYDIATGKVTPV
jgi:carbonic anhydrase